MINALLTAIAVVALNALSLWLYRWWTTPKALPPVQPPDDSAILEAVRHAYISMGLAAESFAPSVDLVPTGKLYEILHHASKALGKDHELRTVQDVVEWLREAPRKEPT